MQDFTRDTQGHIVSRYGDRIEDLRSRLSGWHFAKEWLSDEEREMLYVAEQLMDLLDGIADTGFLH